jgi:tRNA A-37 threonylcarbamoyl transferase component Bud32
VKLGRYETVDLIGEGGMSAVYRGRDLLLGRDVAIKVLRAPAEKDNLDVAARFANEAKITGRLQHSSIVTLFDFGTTGENQTYIVMEFIQGRSLAHHMGRLNAQQFERILRGAALGLDYAHAHGVIHRDIKPSNLLVTSEGEAKILDFGIAVIAGANESRITATGIVVGTPHYLCPEQISGAALTPAADQFALAVVTFEMLTGRKPFNGVTTMEVLSAILMQPPIDPLPLNPSLGRGCTAVLHKALSKKPQDRYPTCLEFAEALLKALNASAGWQPLMTAPQPPVAAGQPDRTGASPAPAAFAVAPPQTRTRTDLPMTVGLSVVSAEAAPADYSFTQAFAAPGPFFGSGEAHFHEIRNKLSFYQRQLEEEYDALIKQMRTTYVLWLVAVSTAFVVLLASVVLFLMHQATSGAISTVSSAMLYFLQRVFQQREDSYRKAAEAKRNNVEYGNQWALVIQTIQGMEDAKERVVREGLLVEAMTERLRGRPGAAQKGRRASVSSS